MKPNFSQIDIKKTCKEVTDIPAWEHKNHIDSDWATPEKINVKPVYTAADLEGMEHLEYAAGSPPFLRGV